MCTNVLIYSVHLCRPIPVPKLVWDLKFQEIAKETSGFSGREISKLAIAWQVCSAWCGVSHDCHVTVM